MIDKIYKKISTFGPGFACQISIIWTSRLNQPSGNIFLSSTNTEPTMGNVTEFSHCSKFRPDVTDFLASLSRHIYPGRVIYS